MSMWGKRDDAGGRGVGAARRPFPPAGVVSLVKRGPSLCARVRAEERKEEARQGSRSRAIASYIQPCPISLSYRGIHTYTLCHVLHPIPTNQPGKKWEEKIQSTGST